MAQLGRTSGPGEICDNVRTPGIFLVLEHVFVLRIRPAL